MADLARMSDTELEAALRDLGAKFPYPLTPNLSASVRSRLLAPSSRPSFALPWRSLRVGLAVGALLIVTVLAATADPGIRSAVAHFFNVQGVTVTRQPSALPSPTARPLHLGRPVSLSEAQSAVSFKIALPTDPALGQPDGIYLDQTVPGGEVALVYRARPGMPAVPQTGVAVLVTEFSGKLNPQYLDKMLGPGTQLEETAVGADPAYWIAGQPHAVYVEGPLGEPRQETLRLAANTLIWAHGSVTYRIESGLPNAQALQIASSMR